MGQQRPLGTSLRKVPKGNSGPGAGGSERSVPCKHDYANSFPRKYQKEHSPVRIPERYIHVSAPAPTWELYLKT